MTIRGISKFTPEVLLSAPRTSVGIPNPSGSSVIYSQSSYSFEKQEKTSEIRVFDLKTKESSLLTGDKVYSNPVWLEDDIIALLRSGDVTTELVIGPADKFKSDSYVAGVINGPADNLRVTKLAEGYFGVAVSASANPDGSIYNPSEATKPRSTGRLYRSLFVRHWDRFITPQRNAIFYGALYTTATSRYSLSAMTNALRGTGLESPIPTFGGTDHFDISRTGLVFVSKDPDLDPAINTKCNIYYVPLANFLETTPTIYSVKIDGIEGAMTSPVFSKDGKKIAFMSMAENGYEADQNQILIMHDVYRPAQITKFIENPAWTLSPQSVTWSNDSSRLYFTAEVAGERVLFGRLVSPPPTPDEHSPLPALLTTGSSIDDIHILPDADSDGFGRVDQLFLSSSSITQPRIYQILSAGPPRNNPASVALRVETHFTHHPTGSSSLGVDLSSVTKIHTPAARPSLIPMFGGRVESWVVRPPNFDPSKRYPLCLLIHGGPQGAWLNAWSTRWNPAVFAAQGYVVVAPNITGSTGYGQAFVTGITEQWGGLPYEDLCGVFSWLEAHAPYVDTVRAVALGASYGGYMINWLQGHALGRRFRALVCHDGIFSTQYNQATDELYFDQHDLGGQFSSPKARKAWARWDPALHTDKWATPQLTIHSEKDYRITMADGLAAFNTLQERGVESQFLTFPDENHFVLNEENSLVWHETVLGWINERVGLPRYRSKFREGKDGDVVMDPVRPGNLGALEGSGAGGRIKTLKATEEVR